MTASAAAVLKTGSRLAVALPALLILAVACNATSGSSASPSQPRSISPVAPVVSTSPGAASASQSLPGPTTTPAGSTEFVPPSPVCPSPPDAVSAPKIVVSVGRNPGIVATRASSTLQTCTTTAAEDRIPTDPTKGLVAHPGDRMTLTLPSGWQFLRLEGADHAAAGGGTNIWPPINTPQQPKRIDVPVPGRSGDSIAGFNIWIVGAHGRIVGSVEILVRISVR
jgi:hypothetical protein